MNQEQLATIRAHYSDQSEAINPGHNVTVNALLDHIAQLEAQRGGSDLVELIRRRYPRMLERGNPLYDAVLADAVQRGWAGVVPAWNRSDFDKVPPEWSEMQCFGAGYELAASRIQPIPAGGALADGMVGVDREEWEATSKLALKLANWYSGHEINRTIWPPELQQYRTIHALRSAKGGEGK